MNSLNPPLNLELRPRPAQLTLLLRAAVVPDPAGPGPWLTLERSFDGRVLLHHVTVSPRVPASPTRLPMINGTDALGYAHMHSWTPADITDPQTHQLRALAMYAMLSSGAELWDQDYPAWLEWYASPAEVDRRALLSSHAEAAARSLRWILAEQWLRR